MARFSSRWTATVVVVFALLGVGPLHAAEPGGFTLSSYEWLDPTPQPGTEARVRVTVQAVVPLQDVVVRVEAPPPVAVRFQREIDPFGAGRVEIGPLPKGGVIAFELRVDIPMRGGSLTSFRITGRDPGGRPFEEGLGLPVGTIGQAPRLRDGALEFRADPSPDRSSLEDG